MKQPIRSLVELASILEKESHYKLYYLHAEKYFFVDARHIKRKQILLIEAEIKQKQIFYEQIH